MEERAGICLFDSNTHIIFLKQARLQSSKKNKGTIKLCTLRISVEIQSLVRMDNSNNKPVITFLKPWGKNSWLVTYDGPYNNTRPAHVEVGEVNMQKYKPGFKFTLSNLHASGNAMQTRGCARCQYPLALSLIEPFPCFGCDAPTLCSRCATTDIPLCSFCFSHQEQQPVQKKSKKESYYTCTNCQRIAIAIPLEIDRCPVKGCERVWGCTTCGVRRPEGLYCDTHSSSAKCEICHYQYPVAVGGYGTLWTCYGGQKKVLRNVCDLCMVKVRTLMDTLIALSHRRGQWLGRPIMDQILRYAVDVLEREADPRAFRWSKLLRWQ